MGLEELAGDIRKGLSAEELSEKYSHPPRSLYYKILYLRHQGVITPQAFQKYLQDPTRCAFPRNPTLRLETILSCINTEPKQAMLLFLDDTFQTASEIRQRIAHQTSGFLPKAATFQCYCEKTFLPRGIIQAATPRPAWPVTFSYYAYNPVPGRYAPTYAATAMEFSTQQGISTSQLLGMTNSAGDTTSPMNRVHILTLLNQGVTTVQGLEDLLFPLPGVDVTTHVRALEQLGLLTYRSCPITQPKMYYWVPGKDPSNAPPIQGLRTLTRKVAGWLALHKQGHYKQIARGIEYPHFNSLSQILTGLAQEGFLQADFNSRERSEITLQDCAKPYLAFVKRLQQGVRDPDVLEHMRERYDQLVSHPKKLRKLLDQALFNYKRISGHLNPHSLAERQQTLLNYLKRKKRGARPYQIAEDLNWTSQTLNNVLRTLRSRLVRENIPEERRNATRYRVRS